MALENILNRIRQIKNNLTFNREAEAMRMAFDQLALLKLRIQTKGQNSAEQPFAPYVPAYAKKAAKVGLSGRNSGLHPDGAAVGERSAPRGERNRYKRDGSHRGRGKAVKGHHSGRKAQAGEHPAADAKGN